MAGSSSIQKVDYTYSIRGWLKEINKVSNLVQADSPSDLFAFKINYEIPQSAEATFNGNISETYWKTANDNILRMHAYEYDMLSRLTSTSYQKPGSLSAPDSYKESQSYDKNGNIRKLQRFGEYDDAVTAMMIDDLEYAYEPNSNRVAKVTDLTNRPAGFTDDSHGYNDTIDDYTYDTNGNIKSDQNKLISKITYNHLNLPVKITFGTGAVIDYIYTAHGKKIKKIVTDSPRPIKVQEYIGDLIYANSQLEAIHTVEGYVKCSGLGGARPPAFNYVYNYVDHLGNIRLSYTKNPVTQQATILEENNYYSMGLIHKNYNMTKRIYDKTGGEIIELCVTCPLPYLYNQKFNGQELQDELGTNMYDMPFRDYDPAIARWTSIDPILHYDKSPYNGHNNNPAYWSDPSGEDVIFGTGTVTATGAEVGQLFNAILGALNNGSASFETENYYEGTSPSEPLTGEGYGAEPDKRSFNFVTQGKWQTAAVKDIYFTIAVLYVDNRGVSSIKEENIVIKRVTVFGMPSELSIGSIEISNEVAAEATANAVNNVMKATAKRFAKTQASQMQIEQYFRSELRRQYQLYIPGGRVNFNSMNYKGRATEFRHKPEGW